jgi:hypothetical protein
VYQCRAQVRIAQPFELQPNLRRWAERRQAFFRVAAVLLQESGYQGLQRGMIFVGERTLSLQDVPKAARFILHSDIERGDQLFARDEVILQCDDAKQQLLVRETIA